MSRSIILAFLLVVSAGGAVACRLFVMYSTSGAEGIYSGIEVSNNFASPVGTPDGTPVEVDYPTLEEILIKLQSEKSWRRRGFLFADLSFVATASDLDEVLDLLGSAQTLPEREMLAASLIVIDSDAARIAIVSRGEDYADFLKDFDRVRRHGATPPDQRPFIEDPPNE